MLRPPRNLNLIVGSCLAVAAILQFASAETVARKNVQRAEIRFNRDVRPILSEKCFFCHGFDKANRKADMRLDQREAAIEDRGGYSPIVPGKPDESELIARIGSADPDFVMPPHESPYKLDAKEIETLRQWIAAGAEYEPHWAYTSVVRPKVEQLNADWSDHPIDRLLLARWNTEGAKPAGKADPRLLMRRLHFDLTGLPPSPNTVDQFVANPSAHHYRQIVEKLLASLPHAEHMATGWLDLVRWADTSGMVSDEPIDTQLFRTYVISAFEKNKPFDQFTVEQLAGDLLDEPTDETLIASAYNRLIRTNCEAGVIDEEALYAMKGEHVTGVSTVWLGSTMACAQCHDHKFDPIKQLDYYRMAAFFDDLVEVGIYSPGDRRVPLHYVFNSNDARQRAGSLSDEIERFKSKLLQDSANMDAGQMVWEKRQRELLKSKAADEYLWMPAELPPAYLSLGDDYELVVQAGRTARKQSAAVGETSRHLLAEPIDGFISQGTLSKHRLFVDVFIDPDDPPQAIAVQLLQGGYGRMGWRPDVYGTLIWGDEQSFKDSGYTHQPKTRRVGDLPKAGGWVRLEVPWNKTFGLVDGAYRHMGAGWAQAGGTAYWGDTGFLLPKSVATQMRMGAATFRCTDARPMLRDLVDKKETLAAAALKKHPDSRSDLAQECIRFAYRESCFPDIAQKIKVAQRELFRLRDKQSTPTLVSEAGPPKTTHLVERGDYRNPIGQPLTPAIPEFLGELNVEGRPTRLDLANWIVSDDNPLTARVFVNRLWAQFFGRGISGTLEDLGGQGEWPAHPELLDWLATEFVRSGWDMRHMIRTLVMSEAYQLSSRPTDEVVGADPENRYYTRQRAVRLGAEAIRDNALAISGLLREREPLTESIYPYQPDTYWDGTNKVMLGSRFLDYHASQADHQHCRTLYAFWKRIGTHPTLLAFDAPSRQSCTVGRTTSNTPGQALVLLNDPIFVEAARSMAGDLIESTEDQEFKQRIDLAFRLSLQRSATQKELSVMENYYRQQREHFQSHPKQAQELVTTGVAHSDDGLKLAEHAAWTSVCRVLLNLHETITRE